MKTKTHCSECKKVFPEVDTLQMLLDKKLISKDIYNIILAKCVICRRNFREIDTPCSVFIIEEFLCDKCKNKSPF